MAYSGYHEFIKNTFRAVPLSIADTQMQLTSVLELRKGMFRKGKFVMVGHLLDLCGKEEYKKTLETEIKRGDPFEEKLVYKSFQGTWETRDSARLGILAPIVGKLGAWVGSDSVIQFTVSDITCRILKCGYLNEMILDQKWVPKVKSLTDFYIVTELVLATMITITPRKRSRGGLGIEPDAGGIPATAGLTISRDSDGSITITATEKTKPFPFAFRTTHVIYKLKPDGSFDLEDTTKIECGVRRGEGDGLHISELVQGDEEYHIGAFFESVDDEPEGSEDEDEESEQDDLQLVPVIWNADGATEDIMDSV